MAGNRVTGDWVHTSRTYIRTVVDDREVYLIYKAIKEIGWIKCSRMIYFAIYFTVLLQIRR